MFCPPLSLQLFHSSPSSFSPCLVLCGQVLFSSPFLMFLCPVTGLFIFFPCFLSPSIPSSPLHTFPLISSKYKGFFYSFLFPFLILLLRPSFFPSHLSFFISHPVSFLYPSDSVLLYRTDQTKLLTLIAAHIITLTHTSGVALLIDPDII